MLLAFILLVRWLNLVSKTWTDCGTGKADTGLMGAVPGCPVPHGESLLQALTGKSAPGT